MTLTIAQIRHLANFAGLNVAPPCGRFDADENETEITVENCPDGGVYDEGTGKFHHFKHVAYFTEYPEEGMCPLGPEIETAPQP